MKCNFTGIVKEWETFEMFPGYYFSEDGEVYSEKRNRLIAQSVNHNGYLTATITDKNGYRAPRKVHRLVYQAFHKVLLSPSDTIDHINSNKLNNKLSNLQILSNAENVRKGNNIRVANELVFSSTTIDTICKLMEKNISPKTIFNRIGIDYDSKKFECDQLLKGLSNNKSVYPEIKCKYKIQDYKFNDNSTRNDSKISEAEAADIYMNIIMNWEQQSTLAKKYGITDSAVYNIKNKKNWKELTDWIDDEYFESYSTPSNEAEIELDNFNKGLEDDYINNLSENNTLKVENEIQQALGI